MSLLNYNGKSLMMLIQQLFIWGNRIFELGVLKIIKYFITFQENYFLSIINIKILFDFKSGMRK